MLRYFPAKKGKKFRFSNFFRKKLFFIQIHCFFFKIFTFAKACNVGILPAQKTPAITLRLKKA
jgi:hypothetical protein